MVAQFTMILGGKMNIDQLNFELECLAEEAREERLDIQYQDYLEEMYYIFDCDQYQSDLELYDEFG